jgi:hypothetical protein
VNKSLRLRFILFHQNVRCNSVWPRKFDRRKGELYNPFGIPIEQLNEQEGEITINVSESRLFDKRFPLIRLLEIAKGQTVFILERNSNFDLNFIQSNPNYETKIAKINITSFCNASKLFVSLNWSEKGNAIYIGDYRNEHRSTKSFEDPNIKFRVGKDGTIY